MKLAPTMRTDGQLTSSLLIVLVSAVLAAPIVQAEDNDQQALREANFKAADAEGDAALTPAEFQAFIDANARDNLGRAAQIKRFGAYDRAFSRLDADNSGTVTWSEIMEAMAQAN